MGGYFRCLTMNSVGSGSCAAGGNERHTLLVAVFALPAATIANSTFFWRWAMRRTAVVGRVMWIGYTLVTLLVVFAFWFA